MHRFAGASRSRRYTVDGQRAERAVCHHRIDSQAGNKDRRVTHNFTANRGWTRERPQPAQSWDGKRRSPSPRGHSPVDWLSGAPRSGSSLSGLISSGGHSGGTDVAAPRPRVNPALNQSMPAAFFAHHSAINRRSSSRKSGGEGSRRTQSWERGSNPRNFRGGASKVVPIAPQSATIQKPVARRLRRVKPVHSGLASESSAAAHSGASRTKEGNGAMAATVAAGVWAKRSGVSLGSKRRPPAKAAKEPHALQALRQDVRDLEKRVHAYTAVCVNLAAEPPIVVEQGAKRQTLLELHTRRHASRKALTEVLGKDDAKVHPLSKRLENVKAGIAQKVAIVRDDLKATRKDAAWTSTALTAVATVGVIVGIGMAAVGATATLFTIGLGLLSVCGLILVWMIVGSIYNLKRRPHLAYLAGLLGFPLPPYFSLNRSAKSLQGQCRTVFGKQGP